MTYEERLRHRDLVERAAELKERFEAGSGGDPVTRTEARELVEILEEALAALSPERWDSMMETVVQEAARRAGTMAAVK